MALGLLFSVTSSIHAQSLTSIPAISFDISGPVLRAHAEPEKPFTVAGERGVVVGERDGTFEAWVLPVKLLSHLTIEADIDGYTVPIDVNRQAAEIEVRPDRTVVTYTHIGFTVREIMFSPNDAEAGSGPVVLFEFDCVRPTDFTFRFTPELRWMWPERDEGVPSTEWVVGKSATDGYYVLHADYPDLAGAVTIPGAKSGILAPYQERPQVHPVELKLHIDPVRDHGRLFPLLMAVGTTSATAANAALGESLAKLNAGIAASYQAHAEGYKKLLANSTSIETPDKALNEAFQWAVISIEQLRTKAPTGETALVAGYYASGDSARPGFGWFFGRDALYTLYAVNGYGDFALSKAELEFLIRRQRADGKIMHEYSQTAAAIDWQAFPYMYAAADATPLFLLAVEDYVRSSGDVAFLTAHREAIEKAWTFETAHDSDGDGIYDNAQGTGWVESWPGAMPHQEIYLALLDQQASGAMAKIENLLKAPDSAAAAQKRADSIAKTIESEYYDQEKSCYAFSRNADGSQDRASTVYPALAWWSGKSILAHPEGCLKQFAAHTLATDWGLRDVSTDEKFYDGMSYHQGSVWPLFTGWAALAEYRANQPLAGYQMLMENANLTRAQDLGAVTELLSGDVFVPFGRSTSHQLWSSAMVITPTLRGLFGIDIDAQTKTITVNPHLPASWDHVIIRNLSVGQQTLELFLDQVGSQTTIAIHVPAELGIKLMSTQEGAKILEDGRVALPRHPVEVGPFLQQLTPGDRSHQVRIVREEFADKQLTLTMEGLAGSECLLPLVMTTTNLRLHAVNGSLSGYSVGNRGDAVAALDIMSVHFPPGEGWKTITVTLTW
jgi:glycogen debranching enzyme